MSRIALGYIAQRRRYFSPNFKTVQHDILHQIGRFHPTPRMRYSSLSVRPTVLFIQNQPTFLVDDGMWIADDGWWMKWSSLLVYYIVHQPCTCAEHITVEVEYSCNGSRANLVSVHHRTSPFSSILISG